MGFGGGAAPSGSGSLLSVAASPSTLCQVFHDAMEAADYAIADAEARIDRRFGRTTRVLAGKYIAVVVLGVPIAWLINGRRFDGIALAGLGAGLIVYAVVDVVRSRVRRSRRAP